jgi:hypothetical protein
MLPDFPETKRLYARFFQTYMRRKVREISPYSAVQTRYLHEGHRMRVVRPDDTESESGMVQMSSMLEFKMDEIEDQTLDKVIAKIDATVLDMARQQVQFIRQRMNSEIPEAQTLHAKGRKLDGALLLEMLEKMQIEFYPDGTPHEIHVDGELFTGGALQAALKEFDTNADLKKRHDDLMERKREEWRAREADRKLVG